jgi:hypothetical protein
MRNKFTLNNPLHVEKTMSMLFVELQTCHSWWLWAFLLRRLLLCFWIIIINPTFISCYDPRDKSWVLVSLLW